MDVELTADTPYLTLSGALTGRYVSYWDRHNYRDIYDIGRVWTLMSPNIFSHHKIEVETKRPTFRRIYDLCCRMWYCSKSRRMSYVLNLSHEDEKQIPNTSTHDVLCCTPLPIDLRIQQRQYINQQVPFILNNASAKNQIQLMQECVFRWVCDQLMSEIKLRN